MASSGDTGAGFSGKYPQSDFGTGLTKKALKLEVERRDGLDQHFTAIWLQYLTSNFNRPGLDMRTRYLTLVAQFAATKSSWHLRATLTAAIESGVEPRELLEAILQCAVFVGDTAVSPSLDIFDEVTQGKGVHDGLKDDQLPIDGRDGERDFGEEEALWAPEDRADPRLETYLAKYPWQALSTGLQAKPQHHLGVVQFMDQVDEDHTREWLAFCYQGMYSRKILDDRTRLLCVAAVFVAIGRVPQMKEHMGGALRAGAKPTEILEVCLLSSVYFGMPTRSVGIKTLQEVLADEGHPQ